MNQIFLKLKFEDISEIDYSMFREINEIIAKIRFEGYGKILAPRYEYYQHDNIVNRLGNNLYLVLNILNDNEDQLRILIRNELKSHGYDYSYELEMPNIIEIFYNALQLDNPIKFEEKLMATIKELDGSICETPEFNNSYDSAVTFRLNCQMDNFDEKLNGILNFLKRNVVDDYFIEYL